jgi:zinc protease
MYRPLKAAAAGLAFLLITAESASAINIQEVTSGSGITAWLVEDDTVPLVAVDIAFRGAGASQDPAGRAGRANLLAALLDEGAGDLDSVAFQTALQDNAVQLSFDSSRDHLYGDMRALSASIDQGFSLLKLALTAPRFDEEAIGRMKAQISASLRRDLNDPETVVSRLWARTAFPDHPYGTPAEGTIESVGALTRDDLLAAKAGIARDNLFIAVVGDITPDHLKRLLDETFGDLPATADLAEVPAVEPATGLSVSDTVETPQTAIRFGGPGLMRKDADFIPAFVMNHIFGGGAFSSWLFEEVREKRGLAYSAYSYLVPYDHSSVFGGGTATSNAQAKEALDVILSQFDRMMNEGPSEAELADAKSFLTGSYALRFDSSNSIARQLLAIQLDDLGIDYIEKRNDLINAVTLDDVRRAAKRIFGEGRPTVAVVGAPQT